MIVRERPSAWRLFFVLRGSILPRIRGLLLANILLAIVVTIAHRALASHNAVLVSTIPFTLMGLPLAIFVGFRNNACYDRYWEARKLWGELLLRSRNLARQVLHLVDLAAPIADPRDLADLRVRLLLRAVAFCVALKALLCDRPADESELGGLLLDAICRGIEIELRQALGDPSPPAALEPVDYLLL